MYFDELLRAAADAYAEGVRVGPLAWARRLMELPGLPMHCPEHHFIVPASLLLAAHGAAGSSPEILKKALNTALARAKTVPGGFCGDCGCCGAAVGVGIFAAVWQNTAPRSGSGWALANEMTSAALSAISSVEGPRCCKRTTFLALSSVRELCLTRLGVDLGAEPRPVCSWFMHNGDCRGTACPFFPAPSGSEETPPCASI